MNRLTRNTFRPERRWQPGRNPLTHERPFATRTISPLQAAVYTACLGPALCLGPDTVVWGLLLLLLPLDCLLLGSLPWPARFTQPRGLWPLLVLLVVLPLQAAAVVWLLERVGLRMDLPLLELALLFCVHTGAFLYLQQATGLEGENRRRSSVQAAFVLPLPLLALWVLGALERLLPGLPANLAGLPRLAGLLVLLGVLQLGLLRRARRPREGTA